MFITNIAIEMIVIAIICQAVANMNSNILSCVSVHDNSHKRHQISFFKSSHTQEVLLGLVVAHVEYERACPLRLVSMPSIILSFELCRSVVSRCCVTVTPKLAKCVA